MYGSSSLKWKSTAALTQRPRVLIPLKSRNVFSGLLAIALIAINDKV